MRSSEQIIIVGGARGPSIATITATGAGSIVVPAGYHTLVGEVWGPGGAGAGASDPQGDGGGGGGYSLFTATVIPGQTIYYNVGTGGVGTTTAGGDGVDSWINPAANIKPVANGAVGGGGKGSNNGVGAVGAGSIGDLNYSGGTGGLAGGGLGGGGGGGAGSGGAGVNASGAIHGAGGTPDGGIGGDGGFTSGQVGSQPGGGGGGVWNGATPAGNGGPGKARLTFLVTSQFLPLGSFDTTGLTIGGGKMAYAKQLSNGNLLYCCMRHHTDASKVGVAEVNPVTRAEVFSFSDPGWSLSGGDHAGPENATKYSNGNYLISTIDGFQGNLGAIVYEMRPNQTTAWTWNGSATANGALGTNLVKPETINGIDYVLIFGCGLTNRFGMEVIRRDNQATVWHLTLSTLNEVSSGAFRRIGGVNYILAVVWTTDVLAYLINFDTGAVVKTYNLGDLCSAPGSGWDVEWIDDTTIALACGFNGAIAVVTLEPSLVLKWKSGIFTEDSVGVATPTTCFNILSNGYQALVCTRSAVAAPGIIFQKVFGPKPNFT